MPQEKSHLSGQAQSLFEQARQMVQSREYDRAIDTFIEGLRSAPEAREVHAELRRLAVERRAHGGKNPTEQEQSLYRECKTPLDKMLAAERLLSKHPEHLPYAQRLLRAAIAGNYTQTATWIADLIFLAINRSGKPAVEIYRMLKEAYTKIGLDDRVLMACKRILQQTPDDLDIRREVKTLTQKVQGNIEEPTESAVGASPDALGDNGEMDLEPESPEADAPTKTAEETANAAAQLFFDKGARAAESGNFDYAIDLYIQGLRQAPEALEVGHLALAHIALQRQGQGGKKPSMVDRAKGLRARSPLEQMINAEYLFAKDPSHLPYAEAMLKAAVQGGYTKTAHWLANLIFQTNNALSAPSLYTYLQLKESYKALDILDKAVAACQRALSLRPQDRDLQEEYKNLTAELTMSKGRYNEGGDFRKSIKDREKQEHLYAQERVIKTESWRELAVKEARKAFVQDAQLSKNIHTLANALAEMETKKDLQEAITILKTAYREQQNFSYMDKAQQLHLKQLRREIRLLKHNAEDPAATEIVAQLQSLQAELEKAELEHYHDCVENYPTDSKHKYEYGLRLSRAGRHDEAIPYFQESQRDPARRLLSMNQIGLAFLAKNWLADAEDVLLEALNLHETKDDALGKELRYHLANTYEKQGKADSALDVYRKIAQHDFAYRDVSERVAQLRQTNA